MKNNQTLTVSAPAKLLLMGEHAVLYGSPCIVTAIDQRMKVTVSLSQKNIFTLNAPDVNIVGYQKSMTELGKGEISQGARFVEIAVRNFFQQYDRESGVTISTVSDFSSQFGFGSSSASVIATLKALGDVMGIEVDAQALFDLAYRTVIDVQGLGSGFDVAAALFGGTLYFVNKGETIEPMSLESLPLVIGYTGVKADTSTLVQSVADKKEKYPEKVERIFEAIGKLVIDAKDHMLEGDWERVGRLMDFNQEYLRDLGVSSEKLETLIAAAKKAGAWGAKLSGAGGGDCMIALVSDDKRQAVVEAIQQAGGIVMDAKPQAEGVHRETTDDQEELFIVVDRADNILGYKTRYECHHNASLIHRTVGVFIWNDKGQLLLQKRSMTKDMEPGLWGISCAGHVTKGQTDEEAVRRELQEELGINMALTPIGKFIVEDKVETERAMLYKGLHNGPFTPHPEEVDEVAFFDIPILQQKVKDKELHLTVGAQKALEEAGVLS
jgi:mevalonate kinase